MSNLIEHEIWKDIPWYEWRYRVSNIGNIISMINNHWDKRTLLLKTTKSYWYLRINLLKRYTSIHRIVAKVFIPNPENKPFVNHKNWIKDDNRAENLEWCTSSENLIHAYNVLWRKKPMTWLWKFWISHPRAQWVIQISKEWNFIKKWDSIMDAQRQLWIHQTNITQCCKWRYKSAWWYVWKYNNLCK